MLLSLLVFILPTINIAVQSSDHIVGQETSSPSSSLRLGFLPSYISIAREGHIFPRRLASILHSYSSVRAGYFAYTYSSTDQ